jgi:hypothetical protein
MSAPLRALFLPAGLGTFFLFGAICRRFTPALPANVGHMLAVTADGLPSLAAGDTRLICGKAVCRPFFVCGFAAFAGDLALSLRIHGGKAALPLGLAPLCHRLVSSLLHAQC